MIYNSIHAELCNPSEWVVRWASSISTAGRVLDLACGHGRHAKYLANLGYKVEAVDCDRDVLQALRNHPSVMCLVYDLESRAWPFPVESFDGIVVTNYLHRPLFPCVIAALKSGGTLIYETFALGNEKLGKPTNPNYLLQPDELLDVVKNLFEVIAYENLFTTSPTRAMVQRICARKQ